MIHSAPHLLAQDVLKSSIVVLCPSCTIEYARAIPHRRAFKSPGRKMITLPAIELTRLPRIPSLDKLIPRLRLLAFRLSGLLAESNNARLGRLAGKASRHLQESNDRRGGGLNATLGSSRLAPLPAWKAVENSTLLKSQDTRCGGKSAGIMSKDWVSANHVLEGIPSQITLAPSHSYWSPGPLSYWSDNSGLPKNCLSIQEQLRKRRHNAINKICARRPSDALTEFKGFEATYRTSRIREVHWTY